MGGSLDRCTFGRAAVMAGPGFKTRDNGAAGATRPEPPLASAEALPFLRGDGDMARRLRGPDWSGSPLGPPQGWSQSLRTATAMMLSSLQPMFVAWGPEL